MLYIDNDTLITLAELGLLDLLCPALGEELEEFNVFCLRSCQRFVLETVAEPIRSVILTFLQHTGPVSGHLHGTELKELRSIERVDLEAELFACCANDAGALVVTGDLNSIRSVSSRASVATNTKLRGRVRCTEQCVLAIINHFGFATTSARWQTSPIEHQFFEALVGQTVAEVRRLLDERLAGLSVPMKELLGLPL